MFRFLLLVLIPILLLGCMSIEEIPIIDKVTQPDYVSSKKSKKLEIPPDFDDLTSSNEYSISGKPTSLKQYQSKDEAKQATEFLNIKKEKIKVIKSGNMRWLVIAASQNQIWPVVESFWEDMGFEVSSSKKKGIIETRWIAESDLKKDDGALGKFDAWLDALSNTTSRRKFRTRIEDGIEEGTTEIFLSQRSLTKGLDEHYKRKEKMFENSINPEKANKIPEYIDDESPNKKDELKSNFKEDDLEIQYELLRRLMVKLGNTDLDARDNLDNPIEIKKAELISNDGYKHIILLDNFSRAWRRLSLAIDMVGFSVEDKNRSDGIFYIKYSNLEIEDKQTKKKKGFISKLAFWQDESELEEDSEGQESYRKEIESDEPQKSNNKNDKSWKDKLRFWGNNDEKDVPQGEKRFRVRLVEEKNGSKIYIDYPDETINKTRTAQSIINILYDYLKS
jgi:outer membrane protein assembly factor BamC